MAKKRKRKQKKEDKFRTYLFAGLIIIIASTLFVDIEIPNQENTITGEYTTALRAKASKVFRGCTDSDTGTDYIEAGFVVRKEAKGEGFETRYYYDFCEGYIINEFYCNDGGRVSVTSHVCRSRCSQGKCVDQNIYK